MINKVFVCIQKKTSIKSKCSLEVCKKMIDVHLTSVEIQKKIQKIICYNGNKSVERQRKTRCPRSASLTLATDLTISKSRINYISDFFKAIIYNLYISKLTMCICIGFSNVDNVFNTI